MAKKVRCRKCKNKDVQAPVVNGIAWVVPKGSPNAKPRPVRVSTKKAETSTSDKPSQ